MTRRLATDISIRHLLDAVGALWRKPRNRTLPDPTLYANLERRTARAVARDRTGESIRDGYPANTIGAGYTNGNGSSVEAHALSRPERDLHHDYTLVAIAGLEAAVAGLQMWASALNSIDDLVNDQGPAPRTCQACTGHRVLGGDQQVAHRGTVGNRLERDTDLCQSCWDFVRQTAPAGTHQGYLPDPAQIAWHDTRGRWQIRIAG